MDATYTTLYETGQNDSLFRLEETPEGLLCMTTNADARRVVSARDYHGWDLDALRVDLLADGIPEAIVDRFMTQIGA